MTSSLIADDKAAAIPVKVAVRARPFSHRELNEGGSKCIDVDVQRNQVVINNKPFYFDFAFDSSSSQDTIYDSCAEPLVDKLFEGYNCTIFAYGQTGSGKTYTMGTESDEKTMCDENRGIIPRIVASIFKRADDLTDFDINVQCSMLEIYEERVLDLLSEKSDKPELFIREHPQEGIFVQNLSQTTVVNISQTLKRLGQGCYARSKGETAMNAKSSRSHAIFTLFITKKSINDDVSNCCQAKLHLVDLAGSERLKKTQAKGERQKEGIKINEGLLALGNVISALTDQTQQRSHIPYRDSKLTRLLQDSLGGNSYTVMITCVSPADVNSDETLSSLRYAERAKKIKNKPTVNLDYSATEVALLRKELQDAQRRLLEYQTGSSSGCSSTSSISLTAADYEKLKDENERLKSDNSNLSTQLTQLVVQHASLVEKIASTECQRDKFKEKLQDLQNNVASNLNTMEQNLDNRQQDDNYRSTQLDMYRSILQQLIDMQNDDALVAGGDDASFEKDDEENEDFDESHFRNRQNAVSSQLEHLLKQIQDKEKLIKESASNVVQLEQIKLNHQKEMNDLREKIETMQKERQELESQLTNASKSSKVSESRRKRMQELEKEIADYRKKLTELQKFEKMKQQNDQCVTKLREEVVALKQQRVQLARQLRQDNQRFREWQVKAEKQMNQMRAKEKRREYEIQLAKRNFDQQLNVHRRKYEEAVAFSKRLQIQLQRQQSVQKDRFLESQENDKLIKEVKDFLDKEIDLIVSTEEARIFCDNLLKQRKHLNQQLLKHERAFSKIMKKTAEEKLEKVENRYVDAEQEQSKIESLRKEILLCTTEIQELQQKISSVDAEAMEERRWNAVNTLIHAKCALKQLFNMLVAARVDLLQTDHQLTDLQSSYDLLNDLIKDKERKIDRLERDLADSERKSAESLNKTQLEQNTKMSLLLHQFFKLASSGQMDDETNRIMQMHCEEAEKMQMLAEQLMKKDEENEQLVKELSKAKVRGGANAGNFFRTVSSKKRKSADNYEAAGDQEQLTVKRSRSSRLIKPPTRFGLFKRSDAVTIESSFEKTATNTEDSAEMDERDNDDADDSDYRETPLAKRLTKITTSHVTMTKGAAAASAQPTNSNAADVVAAKRQKLLAPSCGCRRGTCSNHLCGCVKKNEKCRKDCSCNVTACKNRSPPRRGNDIENNPKDSNNGSPLNQTFCIPAPSTSNLFSLPKIAVNVENAAASTQAAAAMAFPQFSTPNLLDVKDVAAKKQLGLTKNFSPKQKTGSLFTPLTPANATFVTSNNDIPNKKAL